MPNARKIGKVKEISFFHSFQSFLSFFFFSLPFPPFSHLHSSIIGWCLRHGRLEKAEEIYAKYHKEQESKCPNYSDLRFSVLVGKYEQAVKARNDALAKYEEEVRKLKEDPDPETYNRAVSNGQIKKPRVNVPTYPQRYTKEEWTKAFPVAFTSHVLRPLIDMATTGKEIPEVWIKRIGNGLRREEARMGIKRVAQGIYIGDKARYEALQNLLKQMELPYEELTRPATPKVPGVAPQRIKKVSVIKKWWSIGGKLKEEE